MRRVVTDAEDEFPNSRRRYPSWNDADEYAPPVPRRRAGGWVVALAMLAAVGLLGWAVYKRYMALHTGAVSEAATVAVDGRLTAFLEGGDQALTEGNLEVAQGDFDRASALSEKDPRVLIGEARVAVAKAEVPWLRLYLLQPTATDAIRVTKAELADHVSVARRYADEATAAKPADARALRAKIDALRMAGQTDAARDAASKLGDPPLPPETSYTLAALELTRAEPAWPGVIERLRSSAAAEGAVGRARAALVYALAKSGDAADAKAELAKLDGMARPYALSPDLHAFLTRDVSSATAPAASDSSGPPPAIVTPAAPAQLGRAGASPARAAPIAGDGARGSAHTPVQAAVEAVRARDFERARQIYAGILARDPTDSEALTGLGDVARMQGDAGGAMSAYRRAIGSNPSYLPAHLGLADTEWNSGARDAAARDYAGIIDRFPEGTYPGYVRQRAGAAP
ncbi:MAG TPA: tetratricopeptide repeat protein [Polyangiaceae bacterium]|nr:tetratricopeptide repeat protein [Polyangiaceae bacterium]